MAETWEHAPVPEGTERWRVARTTILAAAGWILALPILAQFMRWGRRMATLAQNILVAPSGVIWGRIGVRHYGFSAENAYLAGIVAPTFELTLRRLGWPPGRRTETGLGADPPSLIAYPFAWFGGFFFADWSLPWEPLRLGWDGIDPETPPVAHGWILTLILKDSAVTYKRETNSG